MKLSNYIERIKGKNGAQIATAEMIAGIMRERGTEPDRDAIAEAGRDYGYVAAWECGDQWAIVYGGNGGEDYALADDADDLLGWLIHEDLDHAELAQIRGIEAVPAAAEGAETCGILIARQYYGPVTQVDWQRTEDGQQIAVMPYAEALAMIAEMESEVYCTAHNESGRPSYKIVEL